MPLRSDGGNLYGPGVFDMKAGLVQMIYALRALHELNFPAPASSRVVINSDEQIELPRLAGRAALLVLLLMAPSSASGQRDDGSRLPAGGQS